MIDFNVIIAGIIGLIAGLLGSILGIGGGIFIVPFLTLVLGLPMQVAACSSLITIIANSCTASISYLKTHLTNIRLGLLLETTTIPGAILGSTIATFVPSSFLSIFFGAVLLYVSIYMIIRARIEKEYIIDNTMTKLPETWKNGNYYDPALKTNIPYSIKRINLGLVISFIAGCLSSLLGIGGGVIQVPSMNIAMKVPFKIAVATSSFMIFMTAASGAIVYILKGYAAPSIIAPLIIGAYIGSTIGTKLIKRIRNRQLQIIFAVIVICISIVMILKGLQVL